MRPEETIQAVRDGIAAFNRGDFAAAGRFVHPDYTYTVRGRSSVSGVYRGWDELTTAFARIKELTAGTMAGTPEIVLSDGEHVVNMRVAGSRPDGRRYDSPQAYRSRLKDGLVIDGETIPVDQAAFAEFLA